MKTLISRAGGFLILWFIFLLIGSLPVLYFGKEHVHLWLNAQQPDSFDSAFKVITKLGEGLGFALGILFLFFYKRTSIGFYLSAWLSSVLTVQFLKKIFFAGSPRPHSVFSDDSGIRFIEGVLYRNWESFPSGHTADIFSVCFALALITGMRTKSVVWFIPALVVGYSRVYLSQHFLQDVLAGSTVAVFCTITSYWVWKKYKADWV